MSRNVGTALQTYMQGHGLHMTRLAKLGPFPDNTYRGFAFLDRNVPYDDGDGEITYIARTGAQMSDFVSTSDLSVDNAEMQSLSPVDAFPLEGFTTEDIQAGMLDAVPFVIYAVCYTDLSMGHFIWSGGTIGEVRLSGTALINLEHRSITNKLLQIIGDVDSTTCRAKRLGTQYWDAVGVEENMTEQFPCLYDVSVEDIDTAITAVDSGEPDLEFTASGLSAYADQYFAPGSVLFSNGDNVGIEREIESFVGGVIVLKHGLPFSSQVGDNFRIRRECTKHAAGHNSCPTFWGTSWTLHFRGEPLIPVADAPANLIAGAAVPTDIGGTGEPLPTEDPGDPPAEDPPPGGVVYDSSGTTTRTHGATVVDPCDYGASPVASAAVNSQAFEDAYDALPGDGGILRPSITGEYQIDTAQPVRPVSHTFSDFLTNNVRLKGAFTSFHTSPSQHRDVMRIHGVTEVEVAVNQFRGYLPEFEDAGGAGEFGVSEWAPGIYVTGGASAITIRDATIYDCVGDCVSVGYSCNDVVIQNFDFSKARRQGISMAADNFQILDGEISFIDGTIPQCGIDIEPDNNNDATNGLIRNVHIHDNAAYGILVAPIDGGGININIEDCIIEANSRGIVIGPSAVNCSITGNTIRHNRNPGIWLQSGSTGTTVSGNTFWDNSTGSTPDTTVTSSKTISGATSETTAHIQKGSGASASIGSNTYQT